MVGRLQQFGILSLMGLCTSLGGCGSTPTAVDPTPAAAMEAMDMSHACFVSVEGSDTTGDGSMAQPFRTLAKAAAVMTFFASTFRFVNSNHIRVQDCRFEYPSYNKLVLGDYRRPETGGFFVNGRSRVREDGERVPRSRNCVIQNCTFQRMDGPALDIQGENHRVENCLFSEIDYTCLGDGGEGTINMGGSVATVFRGNTIHTTGNSEGIRVGRRGVIELNRVYNMGLIQHDGSQVNLGVSAQEGSIVRRNWSHDSHKAAVRFDSAFMGDAASVRYGKRGTMTHNVSWNCGPMKVKGDAHTVVSNTGLSGIGDGGVTLSVLDNPKMGGINGATITRNNLGVLSGHFRLIRPLPGQTSGNHHEADADRLAQFLRDAANLDFRPRPGSPLIDAGEVVESVTGEYVGDAPDIGAYEYGARTYWIPGYRSAAASSPIPPDGSRNARADADLMWLPGYMCASHEIYFGKDRASVGKADRRSPEFKGAKESNIFDAGELRTGKRREGSFSSIYQWILKLGSSLAFLLAGFILVGTGFKAELGGEQAASTFLWMRIFYTVTPATAMLIIFAILTRYPLTEQETQRIRKELEARRGVL